MQKPPNSTAKHASLKAPLAAHFSRLFTETAAAWRKATKRLRRFSKDCEIDSGNGCYDLAELHEGGLGVGQDIKTATKYLDKACELGDPKACDRRP